MQIGNGFKVNSVVYYPDFAQVNGEYLRDADAVFGGANTHTFNLTIDEAKQFDAGKVYQLSFSEKAPDKTVSEPSGSIKV